jgi:hypothetical protein
MRTINLAVAATLAAALAAGAASAHPEHAKDETKVERVIVLSHADKDGKPGEKRELLLHSDGKGIRDIVLKDCDGEKTEINEGTDKHKTRVVLCGKPGMTGEERAKRLEEVRAKLAQRDHLGAEHRARVDAALQEAINRARAGN